VRNLSENRTELVSKLSPVDLRRWVGDISVIHVHDGPKRFFVSLHGANVSRHIGPKFHKEYLEDIIPEQQLPNALAPYEESTTLQVPVLAVMSPTLENGLHSRLERLVLPFRDQNPEKVERFLVWVVPNNRKSDPAVSIYDENEAEGGSEQSISLYSFHTDEPRKIEMAAQNQPCETEPDVRGWQKLKSMFYGSRALRL